MKKDIKKSLREESSKSWDGTRRDFIKKPLALAAGSIVVPSFLGSLVTNAKADRHGDDLTIAPRYYPLNHFRPDIDLTGKLAVITGASRGNGRAIGGTLAAPDFVSGSMKAGRCMNQNEAGRNRNGLHPAPDR